MKPSSPSIRTTRQHTIWSCGQNWTQQILNGRMRRVNLFIADYSKVLAIKEKVLGTEHPSTLIIKDNIHITQNELALSSDSMPDFLSEHAFILTTIDGDTPDKQQGMSGEYNILEFADWTQDSKTSLFDKNEEMRGKPKDLLVMKDDIITQHHFENTIDSQFGI